MLKYSQEEMQLMALLPNNDGKVDTKELIKKRYAKEELPANPLQCVVYALRSLQRKAHLNRESWSICCSGYRGPYAAQWSIEKVKSLTRQRESA